MFFCLWIIGLFVLDAGIKEATGKHIHEHVFEWWNRIRDAIISYRREHAREKYDFVLRAVEIADGLAVGMKRAADRLVEVFAADVRDGGYCIIKEKVVEEVVSREELEALLVAALKALKK